MAAQERKKKLGFWSKSFWRRQRRWFSSTDLSLFI